MKVGVSCGGRMTDLDKRIYRGAARASLATGVPVLTHLAIDAENAVAILAEEGPSLDRVLFRHVDDGVNADRTRDLRIAERGGTAAVNLSSGVTDAVLLPGGEPDGRMSPITGRRLSVHDADWPDSFDPASVSGATPWPVLAPCRSDPSWRASCPCGGATDLPTPRQSPWSWRISAVWAHRADTEVDEAAFVVDEDEQDSRDEDFVFYGAAGNPGGAVRLVTGGPTGQAVVVRRGAPSAAARKVLRDRAGS
ncbi:TerD family protein [Streptomyces sp. NPDC051014]|uniref:phosphotriesterase family protein n=1 Tax=Streptomyces sp. NPDC051014 TaxID=3155751 RepID=UPI0033DCBF26